jgi:Ca2+-binding RTX toxin-like protein
MPTASDNLAFAVYQAATAKTGETFSPIAGTAAQFIVAGTPSNDVISGVSNNEVVGGGGDDLLLGGAGQQTLYASTDPNNPLNPTVSAAGADTADNFNILSGGPNNILAGGAGLDIFTFAQGCGFNLIEDFTPSQDAIIIQNGLNGIGNFNQLATHISDSAQGAVINLGGNDVVVVQGVSRAQLTPNDFSFQ